MTIPPETTVREAIALLRQHGYSQVPVVDGREVLGVFSYRSFAQKAATFTLHEVAQQKCVPGDLAVEECLERFAFARVTEGMRGGFLMPWIGTMGCYRFPAGKTSGDPNADGFLALPLQSGKSICDGLEN